MSLNAMEYKTQGNNYYAKNESLLAIESYSEAIKLIENQPEEILPLYLLYSNRSAAFIQDKNFYSGYEDAKQSLKLKKDENFKGFYRAAICAYHLGFIEQSQLFIKEATKDHQQNLIDYLDLKLLIEKKVNCMNKWRKPTATAKKLIKSLQHIIEKQVLMDEIPAILYQIRYLLRSYFENKKDKKLMNMDTGDFGLRLHELAVKFNLAFHVEKLLMSDPLLEDLLLNEMPDVGSLRIKAYEQRNLSEDQRDYDLEDKSSDDLAAYGFSFFVNNVLSSLVVNCTDEKISIRALKQLHRLTTIDLYRESLGDALSDAMNNYIYCHSKNNLIREKLISSQGIEIFFYDYIESSCQMSASRMIKNITADQWKKQSLTTIQFVLKQISKKIEHEDTQLIEAKEASNFEVKIKQILDLNPDNDDDGKENFNIIINVLTKLFMVFGKKPFIVQSSTDPMFLYINQMWFQQLNIDQHRYDIPFLLNGFTSIITQWLKLDYSIRRQYIQQINDHI
ncbi:unnamed protein product [Rotaria magnacalcarata]|uniref:Uncharacterized protein n=1 Tax=Rotaria magnacalcarata TaxID=392030 RepID=A0A816SYL8_9BILA|nr:unnamed protein product [Rotaria magnacalcarata]CAF2086240.1 unnamed protein product [Rotaria magnacalcarata]CAF4113613.1 unnamed protein product [Rotaria magnacalcarata]CAF4230851.1 unnamed protein product [Rotaria magnacalcarata]